MSILTPISNQIIQEWTIVVPFQSGLENQIPVISSYHGNKLEIILKIFLSNIVKFVQIKGLRSTIGTGSPIVLYKVWVDNNIFWTASKQNGCCIMII